MMSFVKVQPGKFQLETIISLSCSRFEAILNSGTCCPLEAVDAQTGAT
jgi:hypothetical protein